ncbi:Gfo/Idh/MocA family protein [Stratiformator vulcanicus]|uniref:Inositol 2-dehydrogenase n=1 Tax=Stratiformator vulcanicus TaxID=2527980 RepID=A0A517QY88_9PLAN|nr:Gfo/Idh/MocA family oxidoreductase [Stratiformator vulcanicus]QDT36639.1 Inositol 2-dehydrogenase [Stratiformator vulcanicus]
MHRRNFLTSVMAGGLSLGAFGSVKAQPIGANDRVRVGWIGCGGRGRFVAERFRSTPGVEIAAVCDVYEPNAGKARDWLDGRPDAVNDFRRILDRSDIDAVLVATPDHWHAIPTVLACQAGKDVYVEKPLGHNVQEGRAMVDAARQYERVVQTGTQQRSAAHFERCREIVQSGSLGDVRFVRIWNYRNSTPDGIGKPPNGSAPKGLDWDFYLGPAPETAFNRARFLGNYRYFWDYAGGIPTDWGTHRFDVMHLIMGASAPRSVVASGGRYPDIVDDSAEVPDLLQATFEYPNFILNYESTRLNAFGTGGRTAGMKYYRANGPDDRPNGLAFYGTKGTLLVDRLGFELMPELKAGMKATAEERGSLEKFRMKPEDAFTPDSTGLHVENFVDCVRSRNRPIADVEFGHHASNTAHLANIAYRTGQKLNWDADRETFGNAEADRFLSREARKPWDLI